MDKPTRNLIQSATQRARRLLDSGPLRRRASVVNKEGQRCKVGCSARFTPRIIWSVSIRRADYWSVEGVYQLIDLTFRQC